MLNEWGKWQPTIWEAIGMDPALLAILQKNTADVEAIVQIVGITTIFRILPHVMAILQTVKEAQKHA